MKTLVHVALRVVALLVLTLPAQAYLEWQPPQLTNGQNSLKTRFWTKPVLPAPTLTGKIQIQLTSQPYQNFVVCADHVASDTPVFIIPLDEEERQAYHYQLVTTEQATTLTLLHPKACAVDNDTYPYHFLDLLHSDKPFLAIECGLKDKKKKESFSGAGLPPSQSQPSEITFSGGGGYGSDDDDQHKHPLWQPFQSSGDYSLMVLPELKLPEELKASLPDIRLYYDLLEQFGYGKDINIILRIADHEPIRIPVHHSERAELAKHLTSAPVLLSWLAPRLNGSEEFISWLLNIQTHFATITDLEKGYVEAIEKQLAMILEQNNSEFNLQLTINNLFSHALPPATDTVYNCSETDRWIRCCPTGKPQQQKQGALSQNSHSSSAQPQLSMATGSGTSEESAQRQQTDRENKQKDSAVNATAVPVPEVTITFVGNSSTGKSTLANLLLGFRHFGEGGNKGLEQDYLHNGIRIRALPGYSGGLPSRYPQQYDIGRDDIIIFVLDDDLSANDIQLLRDIVSRRDYKQDRLIIVRNKYDTLRIPATLEAESSNIRLHESLLLAKDRIQRDIRERLQAASLSDSTPILFTSAGEDSWIDAKELHDNMHAIIGSQNESWNCFSEAFNTIDNIYNEITVRHGESLTDNISRAFRKLNFSIESQFKIANILRSGLREIERERGEPEFEFLDMDSVIAGTVTMMILPPEVNGNLIARIRDMSTISALHLPRYGSLPENARKLLSLGANLSVWMESDNTLFIALGRTIIARILARQNYHSAYQSAILGEDSSIFFSDHARRYFLRKISNPEVFLRKISDLVAGKMAYLKFTEVRKELSRQHSCPGEKCPPPLGDLPPEPCFWQGCRLQ